MKEEIKNKINAENRDKRKLNDAELAQVTGGALGAWVYCDHNCSACAEQSCRERREPKDSDTALVN